VLAAVDVQRFTGNEVGAFQVDDRIDDVCDFAHMSHWMQIAEKLVRFGPMRGGLDDAGATAFTRTPFGYSLAGRA
jgi:hypothetical protein